MCFVNFLDLFDFTIKDLIQFLGVVFSGFCLFFTYKTFKQTESINEIQKEKDIINKIHELSFLIYYNFFGCMSSNEEDTGNIVNIINYLREKVENKIKKENLKGVKEEYVEPVAEQKIKELIEYGKNNNVFGDNKQLLEKYEEIHIFLLTGFLSTLFMGYIRQGCIDPNIILNQILATAKNNSFLAPIAISELRKKFTDKKLLELYRKKTTYDN